MYPESILLVYRAEPRAIGLNYEKAIRQLGYRLITCDVSDQIRTPDILCETDADISHIVQKIYPAPDVVIHFESRGFFPWGWEKLMIPRVWYSTEGDVHIKEHEQIVDLFDLLFSANKAVADYFFLKSYPSYWLPLAVDTEIYRPIDCAPQYDIAFVGTLNMLQYRARARLLSKLQAHFNVNVVTQATPQECTEIYANSHLVFDKSLGAGVNTRPFETLACQRLLLTEENPASGIQELFEDDVHIAYYNESNMIDRVGEYLEQSEKRNAVAKAGYERVCQYHTYIKRVESMVRKIREHTGFGIILTPRQKQIYTSPTELTLRYTQLYSSEMMLLSANKALSQMPESARKWVQQGVLFFLNRQFQDAYKYFKQAWNLEPKNLKYRYFSAVMAYTIGDYLGCIETVTINFDSLPPLNDLIAYFPVASGHYELLLGYPGLRGAAFLKRGNNIEAIQYLNLALKNPTSYHKDIQWYLLLLKADCELKSQNMAQAKMDGLQALENNPYIEVIYTFLADCYLQEGSSPQAQDILKQGEKMLSHSEKIQAYLAQLK